MVFTGFLHVSSKHALSTSTARTTDRATGWALPVLGGIPSSMRITLEARGPESLSTRRTPPVTCGTRGALTGYPAGWCMAFEENAQRGESNESNMDESNPNHVDEIR